MKVLMFGWEFPPMVSGGLGVACFGLSKALSKRGARLTFVVPHYFGGERPKFLQLLSSRELFSELGADFELKEVDSGLFPYQSEEEYALFLETVGRSDVKQMIYGPNLFSEVERYAKVAGKIAKMGRFDVIHCHDWLTYQAGIEAKKAIKRPFVAHVHSIEADRNPYPDPRIQKLEQDGFEAADHIACVSRFTKERVQKFYKISPSKVSVVYNGIELNRKSPPVPVMPRGDETRQILFLGRITYQKGPEYFVETARKLLNEYKNLRFLVGGWGDRAYWMIEKVAELGIGNRVVFSGFLGSQDVSRAYWQSHLFLMPSVSEPFGLTAIEALSHGIPVILSNQSGVSEVLPHTLKADYWDTDRFKEYSLEILQNPERGKEIVEKSYPDLLRLSWERAADSCLKIYDGLLARGLH